MTVKNGFYQDNIYKIWVKNNKEHRINAPANISPRYRTWCDMDKYHRIDGPAFVSNDHVQWWINNIDITYKLYRYCTGNNIDIKDYRNLPISDRLKLKIKFGLQL